MELSLAQVEQATGAQIVNHDLQPLAGKTFRGKIIGGWSIDSRSIEAGDLFLAIKGEHFDGHAFLPAAFKAGAQAAVVSGDVRAVDGLLLRVPDTIKALQDLARRVRQTWTKPLVAVTGSAGKTSTKEIIAALLKARFHVGKTAGNLNNHIGLPLSLLRLPNEADVAVVEMGMNHAGEIRALASIARPQIGVVTNVGYAHIEAFASIEEIAAAKRELIEALAPDGVAVLNADDERVLGFRASHRGKIITYGTVPEAEVRAEEVVIGTETTSFVVEGVHFETRLTGRHGVSNILAGLAVASLFNIPFRDLLEPVAQLRAGKMRGARYEVKGLRILNDSYNSNPEAARSMIDVLLSEQAQRRIAVLGEMRELGAWAEPLHRELGRYVGEQGVDFLVGICGASRSMVEESAKAGLSPQSAVFFEDPESAGEFLREFVRPGDAILFKGSRGTHVERALARIEE